MLVVVKDGVVLVFPEDLSAASVEDLADYLKVFMRKVRRDAGVAAD